ncbi:MAG: ADOP family duplicated permease [Acidobacteriota bacterium]
MGRLWRFFSVARQRDRFEAEMAEEMADHLARRAADLELAGWSPARAQRQARLEFGSVEGFREACREARWLHLLDELRRNLKHGLRVLARTPVLTATVTLTLGLGIGANVSIFSLLDAALLRPLPYPESERLVLVETKVGQDGVSSSSNLSQNGRTWEALAAGVDRLDLAVFSDWSSGANVVVDGRADYLQQQRVGAGFFRVLGVDPLIGREFSRREDVPGGPRLAVLSHRLWQRLYRGRPGALGGTLQLRGEAYEIVGVMPADFRTGVDADLWTPLRPSPEGEGEGENYMILGRLRDGATLESAGDQLRAIGAPALAALRAPAGRQVWLALESLQHGVGREVAPRLMFTWLGAWLLLGVCSFNVTGLVLALAARRSREMATRSALGGGRGAIFRQMLTEGLVLCVLGGGLGVLLAALGVRWLGATLSGSMGLWQPLALDSRALALALLLTLFALLVTGLYPALAGSRHHARQDATRVAGQRNLSSRRLLVTAQLALVVALLVGAGQLLRTVLHLQGLTPGFDADGLVAATVSLQDARYGEPVAADRLLQSVATRVAADPAIEIAAAGLNLPYERPLNMSFSWPAEDERHITNLTYVTPGYFEALRVSLLAGRYLDSRDGASASPTAVVNAAFVRTYLGDREPLGARLRIAGAERRIVGVVSDTRQTPGWGEDEPLGHRAAIFVTLAQTAGPFLELVHSWFEPSWVVRPRAGAVDVEGKLRAAVTAVDPQLPLAAVRSMSAVRDQVLARQRLQASLLGSAAGGALIIAAVGLGGLIAASVAERRRELGIRLALGASPWQALGEAVLPGLRLAVQGLLWGLPLALALAYGLRALVHGVGPWDLVTYGWVAAILVAAAGLASLLPALRVLRFDPAQLLRAD